GSRAARSQSQVRAALSRDRADPRLQRPVARRDGSLVGRGQGRSGGPERLKPRPILGRQADRQADFVIVELLIEHLAAGMEPGDPVARPGGNADVVDLLPAPQHVRHPFAQRIEAGAGQRRDCDDILPPASLPEQPLALLGRQQVELVPRLEPRRRPLLRQAKRFEHVVDVLALRLAVGMRDVAHVDQQIGRRDLFQRRPERRDQLGREVGDEADRVGQDRLVDPGQADIAHGRVEGREQQILREHGFSGQPVEKGGFSSVGIADQGNHRPRRALAPAAVQRAGALHLVELALDLGHALANQPAVGLDLGLAGAAEEAEAAALALEVGPAPDQAPRLILQVSELDLQLALGGRRPLAEYLEDQAGAVDDLGPDLVFQILLLDRGQRRVDDQQSGRFVPREPGNLFDLALAEQGRRPHRAQAERAGGNDVDANRPGQAGGLLDPGVGRPPGSFPGQLGHRDQRAFAARDLDRAVAIEGGQSWSSASSPASGPRFSAWAGCRVETACLYTSWICPPRSSTRLNWSKPVTVPWSITPLTRNRVMRSPSRAAAVRNRSWSWALTPSAPFEVATKPAGGSAGMTVEIECL